MKLLYVFAILLLFANAYEWDDARVNTLGSGFDILTNELRQAVFVLNSVNRSDPNAPIATKTLPKGVVMINTPQEFLHIYAKVISKNEDVKDSVDIQVKGSGGFMKISGSFSFKSRTVKEFISKMNHKVTDTYTKATLAEFNLQTWEAPISKGFADRIIMIKDLLNKGTNVSIGYATYMTDEVLNLFGTHIVVNEKIGGILSKIDAVDITSYTTSVDQTLSASASASFASFFKISGSVTTEHSDTKKYDSTVTDSQIITQGGGLWKTNGTHDDWIDTLTVSPGVTGMRLLYVLDVLRNEIFSNFTFEELVQTRQLFTDRLDVYYMNNYYKGCPDPTASNYVSYANVFDEKMCKFNKTFHFGGLYTTSNDGRYQVANPLTEKFECPAGYTTHKLLDLSFIGDTHSWRVCHHHWFHKKCHTEYSYEHVNTHTYICISDKEQKQGVYFGGAYTETLPNDLTQGKSCPEKYSSYPIYHNHAKSVVTYICMADYDVGHVVSVPFGGLFSSQNPNYLVGGKPVCGDGFERHPLGAQPVTEITYCIGIGSLETKTKDVIPPGYGETLNEMIELFQIGEFENGTKVGVMVDPENSDDYFTQTIDLAYETLFLNETDTKVTRTPQYSTREVGQSEPECYLKKWIEDEGLTDQIIERHNQESGQSNKKHNNPVVAAFAILGTLAGIALIVAGVIIYKKKRPCHRRGYDEIAA